YQETIDQYQKNLDPNDPTTKRVIEVLQDIQHTYSPLTDQVRDAVSVYGDSFAKPRKNVAGFDIEDYIPNILEYMNITTVAGQKAITKARTGLELLREEYDKNPDLKQRVIDESDYVLNSTKYEAATARKFTYYFYLGASLRHIVQNSVQTFMNGVP